MSGDANGERPIIDRGGEEQRRRAIPQIGVGDTSMFPRLRLQRNKEFSSFQKQGEL